MPVAAPQAGSRRVPAQTQTATPCAPCRSNRGCAQAIVTARRYVGHEPVAGQIQYFAGSLR
eukprot:10961800-Lingulodinium_polyedra.AAC.1